MIFSIQNNETCLFWIIERSKWTLTLHLFYNDKKAVKISYAYICWSVWKWFSEHCTLGKFYYFEFNSCFDCPINTYMDEMGLSTACKQCPKGMETFNTGATSINDCRCEYCLIYLICIWAPSSEFVSSSIPSWQILTAHAQPFRGARDLAFCLKVLLNSLLVWASSGGSGETARMRRLAWTFAVRIGYKYQIRLTRSI